MAFSLLRAGWLAAVLTGFAVFPSGTALAADAPAPVPNFYSDRIVLRLGRNAVIPIHLSAPAAGRAVLDAKVDPPGQAEILLPPTVLDGRDIGFVRVRPLQAGTATLRVGGAALALRIVQDELPAPRPEVVTPVAGADVWGKIAVGVELFTEAAATDERPVTLRLPDGTELAAASTPGPREGSHRRFAFTVDADTLKPGINFLVPVLHGKGGEATEGDALVVNAIRPKAAQTFSGACADQVHGPRSAKAGEKGVPAVKKDDAPGGVGPYVSNEGANPGWCLEVEVPEAGWYQMVMTVRGEVGGGALPTVGIRLNEEQVAAASARLADTGWHRLAIGTPFRLPPGDQILTAVYQNDFKYANDRRTLALARYELVRVDGGRGEEAGASMAGGDAMAPAMAGDTMMAAAEPPSPAMAGGKGGATEMQAMAPDTGADDVDMSEITRPGTPLRVAFDRVVDGKTVGDIVYLHGRCWWQQISAPRGPQPRVEFRVNGVVRDVQYGPDLAFRLAPGSLFPGPNTISLHATLPSGLAADAPPQRLVLGSAAGSQVQAGPPRRFRRFTAADPAWDRTVPPRLRQPENGNPLKAILFASDRPSFLALPGDLDGDYRVILEGWARDGAPSVAVGTAANASDLGNPVPLTARNPGNETGLGQVHFAGGAKGLSIALVPGADKKDASFFLRAVRLEQVVAEPNPPLPQLALLYPVEGAVLEPADAAVVRPFSENGFAWIDLALDGKPLGERLKPRGGLGSVVFPLATRDLAPGPHRLRAVAQSNDGRPGQSQEIGFTVPNRPLSEPGAYSRAVFLLDRFGYGPEPDALADILTRGEGVWLRESLEERGDSPALTALDRETGVAFPEERGAGAPIRALHQLLLAPDPARARFVMWTENHFSTWVDKAQQGPKWREHLRFWALGAAPFGDLLSVSATSPAMLVYLDQFRSFASKLNENYAREIMELHTLGVHGGYTQADVTTLAGVLNGWTLSDEADLSGPPSADPYRVFRFDPLLNDGKPRQVFGLEFPASTPAERFDRVLMALEMLAGHPSTARFVCTKLAEHYVSDPPPPALVDKLAATYLATGGDMRAVLEEISQSPEFWATRTRPRLATPLDFSLRLARLAGFVRPERINDFLKQSGTGLFDRATPDGFPEADGEYANSNALLQRWRLAKEMEPQLLGLLPDGWTDPAFLADPANRHRLVDFAAQRVTGGLLAAASQEAAEQVVEKTQAAGPDKAALLLSFLCQLPEANLR